MKNKNIDKDFIYTVLIVISIAITISLYFIDKTNCERKGGVYIWEWQSKGSQCHLKGEK